MNDTPRGLYEHVENRVKDIKAANLGREIQDLVRSRNVTTANVRIPNFFCGVPCATHSSTTNARHAAEQSPESPQSRRRLLAERMEHGQQARHRDRAYTGARLDQRSNQDVEFGADVDQSALPDRVMAKWSSSASIFCCRESATA